MNKTKLKKLKKKLEAYRQSPQGRKRSSLVSIAKQLGRERVDTGKEPTYVNKDHPEWVPLSIPGHPGDVKVGTCCRIIDALLSDIDEWEIALNQSDEAGNDKD